jgi:NADH dehydrogenase (ubiquinone) 1 alpha subcomplex subunit 1
MPAETIPPLAIIVAATALMGASQGWIHKAFYGKPKAVGQDVWDRAAVTRDDRVKSQAGST